MGVRRRRRRPRREVDAERRERQSRVLENHWVSTEQAIYAVYPTARFIPAKVRAFVEFVALRLRGAGARAAAGG